MSGRTHSNEPSAVVVIKEQGPREAADMSAELLILVGLVGRVMTERNNRARLIALHRVIDQLRQVELSVYLLFNWLDERTTDRAAPAGKRRDSARRGAGASGGTS